MSDSFIDNFISGGIYASGQVDRNGIHYLAGVSPDCKIEIKIMDKCLDLMTLWNYVKEYQPVTINDIAEYFGVDVNQVFQALESYGGYQIAFTGCQVDNTEIDVKINIEDIGLGMVTTDPGVVTIYG